MTASPNYDPLFPGSWEHWVAQVNSQVLTRAGGTISGTNAVLLGTAGDNGAIIPSIGVTVTGVVAANVMALFTVSAGATTAIHRLEVALTAVASVSNTAIATGYPIKFTLYDSQPFEAGTSNFLRLSAGESLYAALMVAEATSRFNVHAIIGQFDAT